MTPKCTNLFRSPFSVPNGIQATADGLWVVDQITDRVAFVERSAPNDYGGTQYLKEISTESSNTSGLTWGDGSLWLAANGDGSLWRPPRATDTRKGTGDILRVDPATGRTLNRWPVPDGGGVHGVLVCWLIKLGAATPAMLGAPAILGAPPGMLLTML